MNRSNFELSMDYSCNHKRVCKLSVSTRDCERRCFCTSPLSQGERIKVRGWTHGHAISSNRIPHPPLSLFEGRGAAVNRIIRVLNRNDQTVAGATKEFSRNKMVARYVSSANRIQQI
jgi:hypothetical protein